MPCDGWGTQYMVNQIGLMQGRLTNPHGRGGIQFPIHSDEIIKEFEIAKYMGLVDYIEWTIPRGKYNLFLGDFYAQGCLKNLIEKGIPIKSIDLDYLKDLDLRQGYALAYATDTLNWVTNIAHNIGCETLVIPLYQKNMGDFLCVKYLISEILERTRLKIAFEFLDVNSFTGINFINDLCYIDKLDFKDNNRIGCCFDIGNNYDKDIVEEMKNYNKYNMLYHIHIKEKNLKGESVPLGEGNENWIRIFTFLKDTKYGGDFTLQVARDRDGQEVETVKKQIKFVKELL